MKIYIAAHKMTQFPDLERVYVPLQVGTDIHGRLAGNWEYDNTGKNISLKNDSFNELTGLYWIWKNATEDIVGLCHYRRYFVTLAGKAKNVFLQKQTNFLDEQDIQRLLFNADMIVHNKTFFVRGCGMQYRSTQKHPEDLDLLEQIIKEKYPEYVKTLRKVFSGHSCHLLNVLITRKSIFDAYCAWLFDVLFSVEEELRIRGEKDFHRRMGMLGERLLDVWMIKNDMKIKECFMINTEKVNWKPW